MSSHNSTWSARVTLSLGTVAVMAACSADAPTAVGETYRGVVLYQDRLAEDDGKEGQNHINGNSNGGTTGAVYTPNRSLLYNGGGNLVAACMQIIAGRVKFSGNSNIELASKCPGAPDTTGGRRVRLVA